MLAEVVGALREQQMWPVLTVDDRNEHGGVVLLVRDWSRRVVGHATEVHTHPLLRFALTGPACGRLGRPREDVADPTFTPLSEHVYTMFSFQPASGTADPRDRQGFVVNAVSSALIAVVVWFLFGSEIAAIRPFEAAGATLAGGLVGVAIIAAFTNEEIKGRWDGSLMSRFLVLFVFVFGTMASLQTAPAPTAVGLVALYGGMLAAQTFLIVRS